MVNAITDKILVTGGRGFVGQHVVQELEEHDYKNVVSAGLMDVDLVSQEETDDYFYDIAPNYVIHLAGHVGGIQANKEKPAQFFYDNLQIGINVIHLSRYYKVKKLIMVGTVCSYPKYTQVPFIEEDLRGGFPEETNAPYGIAKRTLIELSKAYSKQYNLNVVNLIPANMYGNYDNFNLHTSHVIPALIRKIYEAKLNKQESVEIWGSGEVSREFLHVEDCARAIRLAMEKYNTPFPVNIGTGKEIYIVELANLIKELLEYDGILVFDRSKPDGQPRRCLDVSKAKEYFGFTAEIDVVDGLKRTINWFKDNYNLIRII